MELKDAGTRGASRPCKSDCVPRRGEVWYDLRRRATCPLGHNRHRSSSRRPDQRPTAHSAR